VHRFPPGPVPGPADTRFSHKCQAPFAGAGATVGPLADEKQGDAVLVCGLGALGTECVAVLRGYGVPVRAVDRAEALEAVETVRGDCRDGEILRRAGVERCRAVVLVTGDARTNVEAALAARRINAAVRIVARAGQESVNDLLATLVGNFVAYEPERLAAGALALAASPADVVGTFHIDGDLVRVRRERVGAGSRWHGAEIRQLARHGVVVLDHESAGPAPPPERALFHAHDPEAAIGLGDELVLLSVERGTGAPVGVARSRGSLAEFWGWLGRALRRPSRVVIASFVAIALALGVSALAFPSSERDLSPIDGVFTALVLMTGGTYADLFPPFHHLSNRLRFLSVSLSAIGTMFVGLLYAWLTERLMTLRLRLGPRRPPAPERGHVVVVGLGRIGRQAAVLYQELASTVAAVDIEQVEGHALPGLPVVKGSGADEDTLRAAHVEGARGVLAVTADEWVNLEVALQVRRMNPTCAVAIRTGDARFSENVAHLLPGMQALCVPVVAARAFAAAALGGRVLDLFQLGKRTVYVVEHQVRAGDGLDARTLAEVAEGYVVVPVRVTSGGRAPRFWSPAEPPTRLAPGDTVVVLGASDSLQRLARGEMRPRGVTARLVARRAYADPIAVASVLVQYTGATLEEARRALESLPYELAPPLYPHQAHRLKQGLEAAGVTVELDRAI
jgi:Trk K+ transport system NAD-binding subunit